MGHEQCIKAYEQCFLVWTVTENYFFIICSFQQNKLYLNAPLVYFTFQNNIILVDLTVQIWWKDYIENERKLNIEMK